MNFGMENYILLVLGLIIVLAGFHTVYTSMRMISDWVIWFIIALAGLSISLSAVLAGFYNLQNIHSLGMIFSSLLIAIACTIRFFRNEGDLRYA